MTTVEYIYLLQVRISTTDENTPVFKVGKTKQSEFKRVKSYPKDTIMILQIMCKNCTQIETELLRVFTCKYTKLSDIGNEYFTGNVSSMKSDIFQIISHTDLLENNSENIQHTDLSQSTLLEPITTKSIMDSLQFLDINRILANGIQEYVNWSYQHILKNKVLHIAKNIIVWKEEDNSIVTDSKCVKIRNKIFKIIFYEHNEEMYKYACNYIPFDYDNRKLLMEIQKEFKKMADGDSSKFAKDYSKFLGFTIQQMSM